MSDISWEIPSDQAPKPVEDVTAYEEQLERNLLNPLVVVDQVYAFLEYQGEATQADMSPQQFFKPEDLEHWRAALAWWPERDDMPIQLRKPSLRLLLGSYAEPWDMEDAHCDTFMERLTYLAQRTQRWVDKNVKPLGRPRVHPIIPGESADERRRRLAREAVARHRAKTAPLKDRSLEGLLRVAEGELAAAKMAKRDAMLQHDAEIARLKLRILNIKSGSIKE